MCGCSPSPLPGQVEVTAVLHGLPILKTTANLVHDDPGRVAAAAAVRAMRTREVIFAELRSMVRVGLAGGETLPTIAGQAARAGRLSPKSERLLLKGLRRIAGGIDFAEWSRGDRDLPLVRALAATE